MNSIVSTYSPANRDASDHPSRQLVSNLLKVVGIIDSGPSNDLTWMLTESPIEGQADFSEGLSNEDLESSERKNQSETSVRNADLPKLKIHVADDADQDEVWNQTTDVPHRQVEQLVEHLRQTKRDLDQREADLQAQVYHWEQEQRTSRAQLRRRSSELEQHYGQVQQQQTQLIRLQQNLVNTQTALRQIIESIIETTEPSQLKQELFRLRFELSESLDTILNRWEEIKRSLE